MTKRRTSRDTNSLFVPSTVGWLDNSHAAHQADSKPAPFIERPAGVEETIVRGDTEEVPFKVEGRAGDDGRRGFGDGATTVAHRRAVA